MTGGTDLSNTWKDLRLKPIKAVYAQLVFKEFSDSRIYEFIPYPPPSTLEALEERFKKFEEGKSPDGRQIWLNWLVLDKPKNKHVAWLQATVTERVAEIAYVVFPKYWKMGYGYRSVSLMLKYLSSSFSLSKIRATMSVGNFASIALARKIGMKRVDEIDEGDCLSNGLRAEFVYEIALE